MTPENDDILTILLALCRDLAADVSNSGTIRTVLEKLNKQGLGPVELPFDGNRVLEYLLARDIGLPIGCAPRDFVVRLRWHDDYGQLSDETETVVAFSPMDAARRCFMDWTGHVNMPTYATAWVEGQAFELYQTVAVQATPIDEPEPELDL